MIDVDLRLSLAKNLKTIRVNHGISVDACAEVLKMSKANYYKLESGEQSLKADWLLPLCKVLGVSLDELFYGKLTRCASKVEGQLREYLRQANEEDVSMWIGLVGSCFRKKLNKRQYMALIELIETF